VEGDCSWDGLGDWCILLVLVTVVHIEHCTTSNFCRIYSISHSKTKL
jgi:hypothetical protein